MLLQRLSLLIVLMCSRPKSGHSALITHPCDTEVLVNHSTYFNCSTSIIGEQIHWYHYRVRENQTNYVYYKGQFNQIYAERYSIEINTKSGEYNLIIRSVQPGDAGRYVCQDDGGLGDLSSAELIVLDATPTCVSSTKPDVFVGPNSCYLPLDKLQLSCSVSYVGNIPPILQWKIDGNDAPIVEGKANDYSGKRATENVTMSSTFELDENFFTCSTTRSHDKKLSCTTEPVKINYAVGQPTILNITKGENITCSANASVPCTYKWFYSNNTQFPVSNDQGLTTNRLGNHSCEASCPINGISCTFVAMRIIVISSKDNNKTMPIAILIVAVIVVILLIIACVLFVIKRKVERRRPKHDVEEQQRLGLLDEKETERKKQEAEERKKQEEEERKKQKEEERKKQEEEERKKQVEEERKKQVEEERKKQVDEERKKQEEEERKKQVEEEREKQEDEERKKQEEEERKKQKEEERKKQEEEERKKQKEEERKKQEEDERKRTLLDHNTIKETKPKTAWEFLIGKLQ